MSDTEIDTGAVTEIAGALEGIASTVGESDLSGNIPDYLESDLPSTLEALYSAESTASSVMALDLNTMAQECHNAVERVEEADN